MKDTKPSLNPTESQDITTSIDNEPAGEWASHTLSALGPPTSTPYPADRPTEYQHVEGVTQESSHIPMQTASAATTPGLQVPGAFPASILNSAGLEEESKLLKDAATNALETAKGYAMTASETVSGYLPASVAAYLPSSPQQPTTLPSSEPAHTAPPSSSGGVGALPGETNIGDERAEEKSVNFAAPPKELGYNPTSMDSSGAQSDPDVKKNSLAHLGDRQGDTRPGHSEGVGELPGAENEEGVAVLPAEHETTLGAYSGNKTALSGASTDASTRSLAGSRAPTDENYIKDSEARFEQQSAASPTQSNVTPSPTQTQRSHYDGPVTNAREHPLSAHDFGGAHNNLNRAPDSMLATPGHHNNSSYMGGGKDTIAPAIPEKDSNTNKAGPAGTAITSATPDASHPVPDSAPTAPAKKYGIMAKLRGEMKILSGKLEHSEEKIEEGRRLMGKH